MVSAIQVEMLHAGLTDTDGNPLAGGKVYTYSAGTTTTKDTYTDADKSSTAANPIVLDAYGRANVYADGLYKFVVKDSSDTTLYTWDNLQYEPRYFDGWYDARNYGDAGTKSAIDSALSAIGSNDATLYLSNTTWTIDADLTIAANVNLWIEAGCVLSVNSGKTLTINGRITYAPIMTIFSGSGTVNFGKSMDVYPQWFGAAGSDELTDATAIRNALNAMPSGTYPSDSGGRLIFTEIFTINRSLFVKRDFTTLEGNGHGGLKIGNNSSKANADTWVTGTVYDLGDMVTGTDSNIYSCIKGHTAGADDERPTTGANYTTYWNQISNGWPFILITGDDCRVNNMVIDGNGTNQTDLFDILVVGVGTQSAVSRTGQRCKISNVLFKNAYGTCLTFGKGRDSSVVNSHFADVTGDSGNPGEGITVSAQMIGATITGNTFNNLRDHGVYVSPICNDIVITGNSFYQCKGYGVNIFGQVGKVTVVGNIMDYCRGGAKVSNSGSNQPTEVVITGNAIYNTWVDPTIYDTCSIKSYGIQVSNDDLRSMDLVIDGNYISNAGAGYTSQYAWGIVVDNVQGAIISHNEVKESLQHGIGVRGSRNIIIDGNIAKNNNQRTATNSYGIFIDDRPALTWTSGSTYTSGLDTVVNGTDSKIYYCIQGYSNAGTSTKPITGGDSSNYWSELTNAYCQYIVVSNNRMYDDQASKTQYTGLRIDSTNNALFQIVYNEADGNTYSQYSLDPILGTSSIIRGNIGFVSENSGLTSAFGSTMAVSHGLNGTPAYVNVVPAGSGGGAFWVEGITTAVFEIHHSTTTANVAFYWEARLAESK